MQKNSKVQLLRTGAQQEDLRSVAPKTATPGSGRQTGRAWGTIGHLTEKRSSTLGNGPASVRLCLVSCESEPNKHRLVCPAQAPRCLTLGCWRCHP